MSARLSDSETAFLNAHNVGRLATISPDGLPHVVPVGYILVDGCVWVSIEYESRKCRNIRDNDRVALIVDSGYDQNRGVLIQGTAELVEEGEEYLKVYRMFHDVFAWVRAEPWDEGDAPFVKITPARKASWRV